MEQSVRDIAQDLAVPRLVRARHGCVVGLLFPRAAAGDASKVAPVDKFSLVLVALFAFAFLGERPSLREWLGIAMISTGVLVLAIRR